MKRLCCECRHSRSENNFLFCYAPELHLSEHALGHSCRDLRGLGHYPEITKADYVGKYGAFCGRDGDWFSIKPEKVTVVNFEERKSLAGFLEPGDATRYEMVAVRKRRMVVIIVMNEGFFDRILFVDGQDEPVDTMRERIDGRQTNPWTVKAAKIMRDKLMALIEEKEDENYSGHAEA